MNNKRAVKIFASLMCADQLRIGDQMKSLEEAGIDGFHLDIMDGIFVPNLTSGFPLLHAVRRATSMTIDSHLMIKEPEKYIRRFIDGGSDIISFHYEATGKIDEILKMLEKGKVKKALAIKPATAIDEIYPYLSRVDIVLVMSVEPGFAGGKFVPKSIGRIKKLDEERKRRKFTFGIQVDGNINTETLPHLYEAGAEIFIGGSTGIFIEGRSFSEAIRDLRNSTKS